MINKKKPLGQMTLRELETVYYGLQLRLHFNFYNPKRVIEIENSLTYIGYRLNNPKFIIN